MLFGKGSAIIGPGNTPIPAKNQVLLIGCSISWYCAIMLYYAAITKHNVLHNAFNQYSDFHITFAAL